MRAQIFCERSHQSTRVAARISPSIRVRAITLPNDASANEENDEDDDDENDEDDEEDE